MQKPSIGRILHFHPRKGDALFKRPGCWPLAAIVATVWSDTCVNLAVFDGNGESHSRTSVLLVQDDAPEPAGNFATWPASEVLPVLVDPASPVPPLPVLDDASAEQAIQAAGATVAPRVTLSQINGLMAQLDVKTHHFPGTTTTVAIAALPDGYVVGLGKSSCISPENFDSRVGAELAVTEAMAAARDKLWELEGYLLRDQLHAAATA